MKCLRGQWRRWCEGQCRLPGPLIICPLESAALRFVWIAARWCRGSGARFQKAALLQTFVSWVINLAVSELSFEVSFASSSPLSLFTMAAPGWECRREEGGLVSLRLPPIHHSSNHLIRAVFDDECAEWRWARETHGLAHLLPVTDCKYNYIRESNYIVFWAFQLLYYGLAVFL